MSFDDPAVWSEILLEKGLGQHAGFTRIPVWIISYEGVDILSSGGGGVPTTDSAPQPVNHEMNIVVSAENGQVIGAFTYR